MDTRETQVKASKTLTTHRDDFVDCMNGIRPDRTVVVACVATVYVVHIHAKKRCIINSWVKMTVYAYVTSGSIINNLAVGSNAGYDGAIFSDFDGLDRARA